MKMWSNGDSSPNSAPQYGQVISWIGIGMNPPSGTCAEEPKAGSNLREALHRFVTLVSYVPACLSTAELPILLAIRKAAQSH